MRFKFFLLSLVFLGFGESLQAQSFLSLSPIFEDRLLTDCERVVSRLIQVQQQNVVPGSQLLLTRQNFTSACNQGIQKSERLFNSEYSKILQLLHQERQLAQCYQEQLKAHQGFDQHNMESAIATDPIIQVRQIETTARSLVQTTSAEISTYSSKDFLKTAQDQLERIKAFFKKSEDSISVSLSRSLQKEDRRILPLLSQDSLMRTRLKIKYDHSFSRLKILETSRLALEEYRDRLERGCVSLTHLVAEFEKIKVSPNRAPAIFDTQNDNPKTILGESESIENKYPNHSGRNAN